MSKRYNLARMSTATTGAGTITLGSAVTSYLSFADAGVSDGETITYAIEDGNNREIGRGVYTASGTTLTRNVLKSTNSDAEINLSGSAQVFITFAAEDISTLSLSDGSASTPSLTNEGDANTGLWFPAADSIALGTGGSEAVRIDSSQNVGIGVTSPTVALDVAGAINTTGNVTVGAALDVTDASTTRTNLGLAIGSDVQAWDAQLDDIAALTPTDGNIIVGNGTNWVAESGATARTSLGLAIGTDVQAYDAQLADVAGLTPTDGGFIVGNGANFVVETGATAITSLSSNLNAIEGALDFEATDPVITWATGDLLTYDVSENTWDFSVGSTQIASLSSLTFNVAEGQSTGTGAVTVGLGRSGSGQSSLDLIGDTTYTSYGLRVVRNNTGANATSQILHRGTGNLEIVADEAADIILATDSTTRVTVDDAGTTTFAGAYISSGVVDDGQKSSGTYTPTPVGGLYKTIQNNGAFTLAPPTVAGYYTLYIDVVMQGSAGTITTSGFEAVVGDAFDLTSGNEFTCIIRKTGYQTTLDVIANDSNV